MRIPAIAFLIWLTIAGQILSAAERLQFNRDIRPILSDSCFACHGPDASKREAGLRLDHAEAASSPLESGAIAIVPGKSDQSELIRRITSDDPDLRMPPTNSNKHLTGAQIETLKRWINEGAEFQGHWAFLPIQRPTVSGLPPQNAGAPIMNPIDSFIISELPSHGLAPSPQADAVTLVRRVAFDLTGLPPSPEQVTNFVRDPSDVQYEKLVDELLASPRYGERMAMWWLDLARYADSVGYHGDQPMSVYSFREWVIRAFNDNKRFDTFTIEQLGGDLLPNASVDQKIAAGYNRLSMMTLEGGAQDKEYLAKYAAERVRSASGAWLGLTIGCAECHDHKFDPTTTKDFYRFEAIFADIREKGRYPEDLGDKLNLPSPTQTEELAKLDAQLDEIKKSLEQSTREIDEAQARWEASLTESVKWTQLKPTSASRKGNAKLSIKSDSSLFLGGSSNLTPPTDVYVVTIPAPSEEITAFRLEVLPNDKLPGNGPGRAENGNFVLTEFIVKQRDASGHEESIPLANPSASFEQNGFSIASVLDGDKDGSEAGWAISPQFGMANVAMFETQNKVALSNGSSLIFELQQNSSHAQHTLGSFRLSYTTAPRPVRVAPIDSLPKEIRAALKIDVNNRTPAQKEKIAAYYRSIAPELLSLREKQAAVQKQRNRLASSVPTMLATVSVKPRPIRVLARGNWMDDSGEIVNAGVPEFLPQPPAKEGRFTRLDLAEWIVSKDNPLPARVFANRLWKVFFGAGLSRKVEDLGAQGEWPSHPALLDWLAGDFIDNGWNIKRTVKQIVMSASYRQSSLAAEEQHERDPYNHWLARQARFRFDAETVRDNALWVSGLLVEKIGGPSVKPYQPPRYWAYLNFPEREWQNAKGDDLYRRGVYTHWQRQYLHPSLLAFDAPSREECTADRPRSNTPLQALVVLNDPTYVEAARVFAELILREGGTSHEERLNFAFRRALSRPARTSEIEVLVRLLEKHLDQYKKDVDAAKELLTVGDRPPASDLDPSELAAWTSVTRAILNLHSMITRN